jgi:2-dehydro-3-deoxyphosphogluconate aldolase / (4S)-4-hydroxy-2-oxoglutarate aldolase
MKKTENIQRLFQSGLVAVVRKPSREKIEHIAEALVNGGVGALEITVDTEGAFEMIHQLKQTYKGKVLVGAGTVLDAKMAMRAIEVDSDFIFSPIFDLETIQLTNRYGKISIPGVLTPTEMVQAYQAGADILKVFPADALGKDYIRNLQGPLGHIPMMPTGGVSIDNVEHFIRSGAVAVGVGGTLLDKRAIEENQFNVLTENAKQFVEAIKRARA